MKRRVHKSPQALDDLAEQGAFIGRDSLDAEIRFYDAAEAAFDRLVEMPLIGVRVETGTAADRIAALANPGVREPSNLLSSDGGSDRGHSCAARGVGHREHPFRRIEKLHQTGRLVSQLPLRTLSQGVEWIPIGRADGQGKTR